MHFFNSKFLKTFALVVSIGLSALAHDQIRIMTENGKFTFENPVGRNGKTASVITRHAERELFIATGEAANILSSRGQQQPEIPKLSLLLFENLRFIVNANQMRTAALYPLRPFDLIEVTALHTLQNSRFEKPLAADKIIWGVQNAKTNKLMDIAIIVDERTTLETLKVQLKIASENAQSITAGYVDHLNEVDAAGELMLTRSSVNIMSQNDNYVFFKNDKDSMVGSSSSGSIIYNSANNQPHSIIICASKVYLNKSQTDTVVRALRLDSIKNNQLIELTPADIESFEKLPCEGHNGRGGGGT